MLACLLARSPLPPQFIMLNVFIAVIIDTFSEEKEGADGHLNDQQAGEFKDTWAHFDADATGYDGSAGWI